MVDFHMAGAGLNLMARNHLQLLNGLMMKAILTQVCRADN